MARKTKKEILHNDMSSGASKIKALLDAGADPNTQFDEGVTPLMAASVHGNVATVDVLLKAGANLELQQGTAGMTALMKAALWKNTKVAAKLVAVGAQVNKTTQSGWTALMYAALVGSTEIIQILLQAGADANMKDSVGKTALHYAHERGHTKALALLSEQ